MLDKKFVRDLNRLIRQPVRKRLAVPALRSAIGPSSGIASEEDDEVGYVNEVWHTDGVDVYHDDSPGATPVVSDAGEGGIFFTRNGTDNYVANPSSIYKNGVFWVGGFNQLNGIASNSSNVFVTDLTDNDTTVTCYVYDHAGTLQGQFYVTGTDWWNYGGLVAVKVNETHVIVSCNEHGYLYTVDGTLVQTFAVPNSSYQELIAVTSDRAYFMTYTTANAWQVYDMTGASMGTVTLPDDAGTDYAHGLEVIKDGGLWLTSSKYDSGSGKYLQAVTHWAKSASGEGFDQTPSQWTTGTYTGTWPMYGVSGDKDNIA